MLPSCSHGSGFGLALGGMSDLERREPFLFQLDVVASFQPKTPSYAGVIRKTSVGAGPMSKIQLETVSKFWQLI